MSQNYADSLQSMVRFTGSTELAPGALLTPWDASLSLFPPAAPPSGTIGAQRGVARVTKVAAGVYDVAADTEIVAVGPSAGLFDAYARTTPDALFPSQANVVVSDTPDRAVKRVVVTSMTGQGPTPLDNFILDLKFWKYPGAGPA